MRTFSSCIWLLFVTGTLLTGCAASPAKNIHWIDIPQLQRSLEKGGAITVGFDIDDTVLFSSPCFHHGRQKYSPGSDDYLRSEAFWTETNGGCDRYSLPKQIARELIAMHQHRGDTLYFITGRPHTEGEQVSQIIQETFGIDTMHPVIFTSGPEKTTFLRQHRVEVYYGDSDSDITSAQAAGARPIRVMRASNSTYQPLPQNGALGEEVLVNSDR